MSIYEQLEDYEPVFLEPGDQFKAACCDCGLTHLMQYCIVDKEGKQIEDQGIVIRFIRDNRATAQLRRYEYGVLHTGTRGYVMHRRREIDALVGYAQAVIEAHPNLHPAEINMGKSAFYWAQLPEELKQVLQGEET